MGMLLTYREGYYPNDERGDESEREAVEAAGAHPETDAEVSEPGLYDDLTDEQVADAYATNVGGRATKRDTQVEQLEALDAESNADQPTEGGSDSE